MRGQDTVRGAMSEAASDGQAALSEPWGREHRPWASELPSGCHSDVAREESLHRAAACLGAEGAGRTPAWQVVAENDKRHGGYFAQDQRRG